MSTSANSNKAIVGMVVVAVLAAAFWILLLSPKREQASELATEVEAQQAALIQAQSQVTEATAAREEFPNDYRQLVTLGKAVPANDETASLLVELNHVADHSHVSFDSLQLSSTGGGEVAPETGLAQEASATSAVPAASTIPPTEAEAALLPLGATIGSAGLGVMPYNLTFSGNFFQVADFIHGVDSMVHTGKSEVGVDGRLVTLDGFSLTEDSEEGSSALEATFAVTTYLVPPDQGLTAGATATSPATTPVETAAPTTTGTPSSYSTDSAR